MLVVAFAKHYYIFSFLARQSSICRIIAVSQHQPPVQLQQQQQYSNSSLRQTLWNYFSSLGCFHFFFFICNDIFLIWKKSQNINLCLCPYNDGTKRRLDKFYSFYLFIHSFFLLFIINGTLKEYSLERYA